MATPSVAAILLYKTSSRDPEGELLGTGSGVVWDKYGHIVRAAQPLALPFPFLAAAPGPSCQPQSQVQPLPSVSPSQRIDACLSCSRFLPSSGGIGRESWERKGSQDALSLGDWALDARQSPPVPTLRNTSWLARLPPLWLRGLL